jgi:hypothetical protein
MEKSINISRSIMLYIVQLLAVQYIVNRQEQSTNLYLFIYIRFTSSLCCILYIIKVLALNTTESKLYSSYSSMLLLLLMGSTHNNITNNSKHKTQRVYNTLIYKDIYSTDDEKVLHIYFSSFSSLYIVVFRSNKDWRSFVLVHNIKRKILFDDGIYFCYSHYPIQLLCLGFSN